MTKRECTLTQSQLRNMVWDHDLKTRGLQLWDDMSLRDQLSTEISDTYKSLNGFRPRPNWSTLPLVEMWKWAKDLRAEVEAHFDRKEARRKKAEEMAKKAEEMAKKREEEKRAFDKKFNALDLAFAILNKR